METSTYEQQAENFLTKTGVKMSVEFVGYKKHFADDANKRDVYKITLERGKRKFSFEFGQSIVSSGEFWLFGKRERGIARKIQNPKYPKTSSIQKVFKVDFLREGENTRNNYFSDDWDKNKNFKEPTAYDVLACLHKSDVDTLEDFCSEFGYDTDSKKAEKIYNAVSNEWKNICMIWTDEEIEKLQEIN